MSVAMETGEGPLDELDPDSTVDERRITVVYNDGGRIERGGSHRSRLREREGGVGMEREGRRGFFPCNGGCAIIITRDSVVGAFDHFTDRRFTSCALFSKTQRRKPPLLRHMGHGEIRGRKDKSRVANSKPKPADFSVPNSKTQRLMISSRERQTVCASLFHWCLYQENVLSSFDSTCGTIVEQYLSSILATGAGRTGLEVKLT